MKLAVQGVEIIIIYLFSVNACYAEFQFTRKIVDGKTKLN